MPDPAPASPSNVTIIDVHQDEVLTGEAVALDVQPLGYFLRALGTLIDMLTGVGVFILFALVATWLTGQGVIDSSAVQMLAIAMFAIVTVVIPTVVETATRGRSLGRLAMGGRIVRSDGGAAGFRHAFIRALIGVLELWLTFGAIAALVGAFTPRSQRLGDLVAGTYCERTRAPALPAPAPPAPDVLAPWAATADVARLPDRLARRITQFVRQAEHMQPAARARVAESLCVEVTPFVSPVPAADPEGLLRAVVAVRRDRELRALVLEEQRVATLTAGTTAAPLGFPER